MTTISTRILLVAGKGGVGKTTIAAGTALRCADQGLRTIVVSTDAAHSLADAFDLPLGSEARSIGGASIELWAQQADATRRLEEAWGAISRYLVALFDWAGLEAVEAEELSVLPGLEELFALADLKAYAESGEWDVVVVDCAPTAETLRLLSLPDVLTWWMERVFPASRTLTGLLRPFLHRLTDLPVASDETFAAAGDFVARLDGVRAILTDPDLTSVRIVVNAERVVVAEARRLATYLSLFGYCADAVVVNRLLPDAVTDPWFKAWKEAQAEHLVAIEAGFHPVPVLRADLADHEVVGLDHLRRFGEDLYANLDPAAVLHREPPMSIEREGNGLVLGLALPFADRDDLEVGRRNGELLVRAGAHRRAIVLPDTLRHRVVVGATMLGDRLAVSFGDVEQEPAR